MFLIVAVVALLAVALACWLLFNRLAEEIRYWPDAARQAAYGLAMLHMLAVVGVVRVGGFMMKRLVEVDPSEHLEDGIVLTLALWGAIFPFILIGDRWPQTHAGGAALGIVTASIAIASALVARRSERSIAVWIVWGSLGVFYLIYAIDETGEWLSPATTAGCAMLAVGVAWEAWRDFERKLRRAARAG